MDSKDELISDMKIMSDSINDVNVEINQAKNVNNEILNSLVDIMKTIGERIEENRSKNPSIDDKDPDLRNKQKRFNELLDEACSITKGRIKTLDQASSLVEIMEKTFEANMKLMKIVEDI